MPETEAQSVLHRMAAAGRDAAPRCQAVQPARAFANGLSRAAQSAMSLTLVASSSSDRTGSLAELLETLPENGLLAVLDGPGEAQGLMALDNALLSALIEMQMTGALGHRPPPRRVTRTDAALAADLIDAALREFEAAFLTRPEASWAAGFGYGSHVEDIRPLGLLLEDQEYRVIGLDLDLAEGQRQGRAVLALPAQGRGQPGEAGAAGPEASRDRHWEDAMQAAVLGADVRLEAIMHRLRMPFAEVARLKAGDEIELPAVSIDRVRLVGFKGRTCAIGRLGQSRGNRALRINAVGDVQTPSDAGPEAAPGRAGPPGPGPDPAAGGTVAPFEPVTVSGSPRVVSGGGPAPVPDLPVGEAMASAAEIPSAHDP